MGDYDIPSQDVLDDLLSQISGGVGAPAAAPAARAPAAQPVVSAVIPSAAGKDVKSYDFSRASKFSKDQIRTIQMIHETFARLFSSTLSAKIRTLTRIKVVSVEEVTYEDFINTVSNPSIISIYSLAPLEGNSVIDISPQIGFPLMDRLLGGTGKEEEEPRELTDIEINLMESVIIEALNFMKDAWSNVVALNPKLELLESNPYFVQIVPPSEMIVLVNLEAEIGEKTGRMNIAIPYVMLEKVLNRLSIQQWFATFRRVESPETKMKVEQRLLKTTVPFIVQLGKAKISLKDFLNLAEGDIIQVSKKVNDDLDVIVGDRTKFKGRPGVLGKRLAVQTTTVVKEK
ncbi:MAG: flagellar motor switch protein FliM, partial [bacterium]